MKRFQVLNFIIILLIINILSSILFFFFGGEEKTLINYLQTLAISAMYTFGYGISNGLLNVFLDQRFSWISQTKQRIIATIISTLALNIALTYGLNYVNYILIPGRNPELFFSQKMTFIHWFYINFALLISAFLHAKGFIDALKQNAKQQVVEQKIIAKSTDARFESLKNQLDPHFLFNSLNVLSSLIDENPEQAKRFNYSLSNIYRYVLEHKDKEIVTLKEEIDFAKIYCNLLKTRFEDSINFHFEINEKELSKYVIPLSLQLLLENCIKHNFATATKPLDIRIYTENNHLGIENNLQARTPNKNSKGIGLQNIAQRYILLTEQPISIETTENYFKVKIPLLTEKIEIMKTDTTEIMAYQRAKTRVEQLGSFYAHLITFCIIIPFLFLINWFASPNYWWAFWPLLGWGIGLVSHAIRVFGIGKNWEEKQIRKYMEQEKQQK